MRPLALSLLLLLAACRVDVPAAHPKASTGVGTAGSASPAASATPARVASPTAQPSPLPLALLNGTVAIEANYLIANNAGNLNGGVLNLGAGLVSKVRPFLTKDGGSLLSDNGTGILSDNGTGLVVAGTAGLVSRARYGLLASEGVAAGVEKPVAGMAVRVYAMDTGAALDLRYPDGTAVFPLATDAQGAFQVPVPAGLAGNVVVAADVPNSTDPRLHYSVIVAPKTGAVAAIDEDTAAVAYDVRYSTASKLLGIMQAPDEAAFNALVLQDWAGEVALHDVLQILRVAAQEADIAHATPERAQAMAQAAADTLLARIDLATLPIDKSLVPAWHGPDEPALTAFKTIMGLVREHTAAALAADPGFFEKQAYFQAANQKANPPFQILKAADANDFLVRGYLATNDLKLYSGVRAFLFSLGIPAGTVTADNPTGEDQTEHLKSAIYAIIFQVGSQLLDNPGGVRDRAIARIKAAGQGPT